MGHGGHVTSAAILDFRICPEKSEEKKFVSKLFFQLKSMDKQVIKNNHYFIYIDTFNEAAKISFIRIEYRMFSN
jgi:hypothetical protein